MIVLCPTRGRPERAAAMLASFHATAALPSTRLVLVTDRDDPNDYSGLVADRLVVKGGSFVQAMNEAAELVWNDDDALGCIGDDFLFRSVGWDIAVQQWLPLPFVAYGNDLFQGPNLPTAVFMSSVIPRALGWYVLPTLHHLFADNVWKTIGEQLGALHYLPNVVIEHMHPAAQKASWDAGYERVNSSAVIAHDQVTYEAWLTGQMDADLDRVWEAMA